VTDHSDKRSDPVSSGLPARCDILECIKPLKALLTTAKFPGFVRDPLFNGSGERRAPVSRHAVAPGILGEDGDVGVALPGDPSFADLAVRLVSAVGGRSAAGGAACGS
jgi:hypothetical protein